MGFYNLLIIFYLSMRKNHFYSPFHNSLRKFSVNGLHDRSSFGVLHSRNLMAYTTACFILKFVNNTYKYSQPSYKSTLLHILLFSASPSDFSIHWHSITSHTALYHLDEKIPKTLRFKSRDNEIKHKIN